VTWIQVKVQNRQGPLVLAHDVEREDFVSTLTFQELLQHVVAVHSLVLDPECEVIVTLHSSPQCVMSSYTAAGPPPPPPGRWRARGEQQPYCQLQTHNRVLTLHCLLPASIASSSDSCSCHLARH
jgi:hypothetical protein